MSQVVQISCALAILAAYALAQFGVLGQSSRSYLTLNLAGAVVLAVNAYFEEQWGFLLLEGAWAVISAWGFVGRDDVQD